MNRKEFKEYVIERVRNEVEISLVIGQYVYLKLVSGEHEGLCPFHNDTKVGSFKVTDKLNIYKCFSCGAGGDVIKFIALKKNISYEESAMSLALEYKIISINEYEDFFKDNFNSNESYKNKIIYIQKQKVQVKKSIAEDEILNNVFTAFLKESSLSQEHLKYLKEVRYLSDTDIIEGDYFTFPSTIIMKNFELKLKQEYGYEPSILKNIPGFYRIKSNNTYTFSKNKGIGICIKNAKGLIIGIQIRKDTPQMNKKYTWFSSSYIEKDEKLMEKYDCATGSPCGIDVIYPKELKFNTIFITEGRFKAKKVSDTFGCVAISVQGVGNWRNIKSEIDIVNKTYDYTFKNIFVAYDADIAYNIQVFQQAMKMIDNLKINFKDIRFYYAMWSVDIGKGIDDLINAGYENDFELIETAKFENLYKNFINTVEKKHGKIVENKVPKEIIKEYFNEIIIKENFKRITHNREIVGL